MPTITRRSRAIFLLLPLEAAGVLLPPGTNAQTPPPEKCVAPTPSPSGQNGGSSDNHQDLSKNLGTCHGELKAPPVGDGKMVEPAPDTGNSRVIKPSELPTNANPSNGSLG